MSHQKQRYSGKATQCENSKLQPHCTSPNGKRKKGRGGGGGGRGNEKGRGERWDNAKLALKPNCCTHQVWCRSVLGSPSGARDFHYAMRLQHHNVSLYIQRLLNNESTMFRLVHPIYPTADIPSRIKNSKCICRADSTKMLLGTAKGYSLLYLNGSEHPIVLSTFLGMHETSQVVAM